MMRDPNEIKASKVLLQMLAAILAPFAIFFLFSMIGNHRDGIGAVVIGFAACFGIPIYFLPAFIAHRKRSTSANTLTAVNLMLGWTLIGWVVCLGWAMDSKERTTIEGERGSVAGWFLLIVFTCCSVMVIYGISTNDTGGRTTPQEIARQSRDHCVNDKIGAYGFAKSSILAALKAPSTAEFSSYNEKAIETSTDCKYIIAIYVDAQNSFGAKIRTSYQLILKAVGSDEWQLLASRTI